jgi:hypothetical protein
MLRQQLGVRVDDVWKLLLQNSGDGVAAIAESALYSGVLCEPPTNARVSTEIASQQRQKV